MSAALLAATLLAAAADRELCTDRPGLGTPACTVAPGRLQIETGLADWTRDEGMGARTDTVLLGDTLVRFGVGDRAELRLGWTPLGLARDRDAGGATHATRIGDVTLGAKLNLAHPDRGGFAVAVLPAVTLPTGRRPIGAGDWGAGLIVPVTYELGDVVQLQASPELDAAVDEDGHGRHARYGATVGVGLSIADTVDAAVEVQTLRDRDPGHHATEALAGFSLAWRRSADVQLDAGVNLGLDHASDDVELYAGVSARF